MNDIFKSNNDNIKTHKDKLVREEAEIKAIKKEIEDRIDSIKDQTKKQETRNLLTTQTQNENNIVNQRIFLEKIKKIQEDANKQFDEEEQKQILLRQTQVDTTKKSRRRIIATTSRRSENRCKCQTF